MNEIKITAPISNCERTGLPRVARFTDLSINSNGSIHINYVEDTLDNHGEVFVAGQSPKSIFHNPYGDGSSLTEELEGLINAVIPSIESVLEGLNVESANEEE